MPTPPPSPTLGSPATPAGGEPTLASAYADAILRYGRICMGSPTKESPFQLAAAREGLDFRGGKVDELSLRLLALLFSRQRLPCGCRTALGARRARRRRPAS